MTDSAKQAERPKTDGTGAERTSVIRRQVPTLEHERTLADKGYSLIVGFDEVGRGSLAGPAMVGAVALMARDIDDWSVPAGLADSKILTKVRRESLFVPLKRWSVAWAVGAVSAQEVDDWGITYALGVAAVRALNEIETLLAEGRHTQLGISGLAALGEDCGITPHWHGTIAGLGGPDAEDPTSGLGVSRMGRSMKVAGILDGPNDYITPVVNSFDAPDLLSPIVMTTVVKGDRQCASVAAASVVSKVVRDRLMTRLAAANPQWDAYAWASNKGYGSAAHRSAIAAFGPTPYHRRTWHLC